MILGWITAAAFIGSYVLTAWLLRKSAISRLVDRPNSRSSHTTPTPRGGGLSIVAVTTCGVIILYSMGRLSVPLVSVLVLGGLSVALVGFWDDFRSAPIAARITVHIAAAIFAVYWLALPDITLGGSMNAVGAFTVVLTVLSLVWILNLFNFMDGIDGIAASEAAFTLFGAAALQLLTAHSSPDGIAPTLILGAACLGFLLWNWQPAAIFMGDVGSGYLGYAIAVLALQASQTNALNIYPWLILGGVFLVDATMTLIRRLLRRERVYQAHRTHAYQWLARRWRSHAKVTVTVIIIDLFWLFPCAALAAIFPTRGAWICLFALAPLAAGALFVGAGREE